MSCLDPIELKCNHIFCTSCVQMHSTGRLFNCPICRAKVSKSSYRTAQETNNAIKFLENVAKVKQFCSNNHLGKMASGEPPDGVHLKPDSRKSCRSKPKVCRNSKREKEGLSTERSASESGDAKYVKSWLDNSKNNFSRQSLTQQEELSESLAADDSITDFISASQSGLRRSMPVPKITGNDKDNERKRKSLMNAQRNKNLLEESGRRMQKKDLDTPLDSEVRIEEINSNPLREEPRRSLRQQNQEGNRQPANTNASSKRKQTLEPIAHHSGQSTWMTNNISNIGNISKKLKLNLAKTRNEEKQINQIYPPISVTPEIRDKNLQTSDISDSQYGSEYSTFLPKISQQRPPTLVEQTIKNACVSNESRKTMTLEQNEEDACNAVTAEKISVDKTGALGPNTRLMGHSDIPPNNSISISKLQENYSILMQQFTTLRSQCQAILSNESSTAESSSTSSMLAIIDKHLLHLEPRITKINELFNSTSSSDGTLGEISTSRMTQTEDIGVQCMPTSNLSHKPQMLEKYIQTDGIYANGIEQTNTASSPRQNGGRPQSSQHGDDIFIVKTQELNAKLPEDNGFTPNAGFTELALTELLLDLQRNRSSQYKGKNSEAIDVSQPFGQIEFRDELVKTPNKRNDSRMTTRSPLQSSPRRTIPPTITDSDEEEELNATLVNQYIRPDVSVRFNSQTQESQSINKYLDEGWERIEGDIFNKVDSPTTPKRNAERSILNKTENIIDACNKFLCDPPIVLDKEPPSSDASSSKTKSTLHNVHSDVIYTTSSDSISTKILDVDEEELRQNMTMKTPEKKRQTTGRNVNEIASDEDVIYGTPETTPHKRTCEPSTSKSQYASPDIALLSPPPAFQDDAPFGSDDSIFISNYCRPLAQENKENVPHSELKGQSPKSWKLSPIPCISSKKLFSKSSLLIRRVTSTPKAHSPHQLERPKSTQMKKCNVENVGKLLTPRAKQQRPAVVSCTRLFKEQLIAIKALSHHKLATYSHVFDSNTTHMVVSTTENNCLRDHTIKYVSAVAAGLWVVNFKWVQDSFANNKLMPEEEYEVKDVSGVEGPKLSRLARLQSGMKPLLNGFKFYIAPPIVSATVDEVMNVIEMLGGVTVASMDALLQKENYTCVIITELLSENYEKYEDWFDLYKTVTVDVEWLTRSVGQFRLLSLRRFALCSDDSLTNLGYPCELLTVEPFTRTYSHS